MEDAERPGGGGRMSDGMTEAETAMTTEYVYHTIVEALRAENERLKTELPYVAQMSELRAEVARLGKQLSAMREIAQGNGPFCERCGRGDPKPILAALPKPEEHKP
jgi:hypothetical protein